MSLIRVPLVPPGMVGDAPCAHEALMDGDSLAENLSFESLWRITDQTAFNHGWRLAHAGMELREIVRTHNSVTATAWFPDVQHDVDLYVAHGRLNGSCSCSVSYGSGSACKHVAALVFSLLGYPRGGHEPLVESDETAIGILTEIAGRWEDPYGIDVFDVLCELAENELHPSWIVERGLWADSCSVSNLETWWLGGMERLVSSLRAEEEVLGALATAVDGVLLERFWRFQVPRDRPVGSFTKKVGSSLLGLYLETAACFLSDDEGLLEISSRTAAWLSEHPNILVPWEGKVGEFLRQERDLATSVAVELEYLSDAPGTIASNLPPSVKRVREQELRARRNNAALLARDWDKKLRR